MQDRAEISKFLALHQPDILALQETHIKAKNFATYPAIEKAFPKYHLHYIDAKGDGPRPVGGQILLIKDEWKGEYTITEKYEGRVADVSFKITDKLTWRFWFTYAPAESDAKPKFWKTIKEHILREELETGEMPFLLMGDLNIAPNPSMDRKDLANKTRKNTEECKYFSSLLDNGLTDLWRDRNEGKRKYTFLRPMASSWRYHYTCDNCNTEIKDKAYSCDCCESFDLCKSCLIITNHDAAHKLNKIKVAEQSGELIDTQESRIDLMIGNTLVEQLAEEVDIMDPVSFAPDHSPIQIKLALPREKYVMKNNNYTKKNIQILDKTKFKEIHRMQCYTKTVGKTLSRTQEGESINDENELIKRTIINTANDIFGIKECKSIQRTEKNPEITVHMTNIRRLRKILNARRQHHALGVRKIKRIEKAIRASQGQLPKYTEDNNKEWYASVIKLMKKEQKLLETSKIKARKDFIRNAVE